MPACRTNGRDATDRTARLWRNIFAAVPIKIISNDGVALGAGPVGDGWSMNK